MIDKEIRHRLIDLDLSPAEIARRIEEKTGQDVNYRYIGMILAGERLGAKYRREIARLLKIKVSDLPRPPLKDKKRSGGSRDEDRR